VILFGLKYDGESKSNGKHFNSCNRSTSNFTYFSTQSPCNTTHLLYRSTNFCIPAEKKLSGCSQSQVCTTSFTSSLEVDLRPRNASFRGPTHKPFVDSWCSFHTEPTYDRKFPQVSLLPKETALRHVLQWSNLAKEHPRFRPHCYHSNEGRALYCKWLNSSTGIVNTVQCTSSSLSRLPRNLKIAFTF